MSQADLSRTEISRPAAPLPRALAGATGAGAGAAHENDRRRLRRFLVPALVAFVLANVGVFGGRFLVQWQRARAAATRARAREMNDRGFRLADRVKREGIQNVPSDSVQAARYLFEEAIRVDPKYAVPWNNLGDLLRLRSDLVGAERDFHKAIELDPNYAVARTNLAGLLEQLLQFAAAEQEYRLAMAQDSTLVAAPNNLGHLLTSQRRGPEAIAVLEPALRRWPDVAPLWKNYGQALLDTGRMDAADSALSRSLDLAPGQEVVIRNLMRIAGERGRTAEQAARMRQRAAGRDPALASRVAALLDSLAATASPPPAAPGASPRPSHPRVQRPVQGKSSHP
jgi:Tfp pilus assembly protein PilF